MIYKKNTYSQQDGRKDQVVLVQSTLQMSSFANNISSAQLQSSKTSKDPSEKIWLIEGLYTSVKLINCKVNVYALKKLISWNLKSLRFIEITNCEFYLSDSNATEKRYRVRNGRMLQEMDFVFFIQTFQFYDIEEITINILKEKINVQGDVERGERVMLRDKFQPTGIFGREYFQEEAKETATYQKVDEVKLNAVSTKKELIEEFGCEEQCLFLTYEMNERPTALKFLDENEQEKLSQQLIWGDLKDERKIEEKLDRTRLDEIKENLRFYKTFTKFALMENKLLILGDVLYHNVSQQQLYNLIQLNQNKITSVIFKDTGRIPSKILSDLMNQLQALDTITEISFLSSVLEEDSFQDLQYLIGSKQIQFMVVYCSHFLQKEIDALVKMFATKKNPLIQKVIINHNRYTIIDFYSKTHYEFTPFAFQSASNQADVLKPLLESKDVSFNDMYDLDSVDDEERFSMMMDVERLYHYQQTYPKQIYNRIVFYQGKNLSIVSKNVSDRILFKYWDIVKKRDEGRVREDKEKNLWKNLKQEQLIGVLEKQLNQDDINVVNCGLVHKLVLMVQEEELRDDYLRRYRNSKSYFNLSRKYPISVVENIRFEAKYHIATAVAYMLGFTRIPGQSLYFYINNRELHESLCRDRQSFGSLITDEYSLVIKEQVRIGLNALIMASLSNSIDFNQLTRLNLDGIKDNQNFQYLNKVLIACKNLQAISMKDCLLNDFKLLSIDFSLISSQVSEVDLSKNRDIDDLNFLKALLTKAKHVSKLILADMQLNIIRLYEIKIGKLCQDLQFLDLSNNCLADCQDFLNDLFAGTINLTTLVLQQCQFISSSFESLKFPQSVENLDISSNTEAELSQILQLLIHPQLPHLLVLEARQIPFKADGFFSKSETTGEQSIKLEKLILQRNQIANAAQLNGLLSGCYQLNDLQISYQNMDDQNIGVFLDTANSNLLRIDLSNSYFFKKTKIFLNTLFQKQTILRQFIMSFSSLSDEKLEGVDFSLVSSHLEEFDFGGNSEIQNWIFLNAIFQKCKELKIVRLNQLKLTDDKLSKVDFSLLGSKLEQLDLSQNENIGKLYFLNDIFKNSNNLTILDLSGIHLTAAHFNSIAFDLLPMHLQFFKIDEDSSKNKSFNDWLAKKLNRYLNIHRFQKHYANVDLAPYLNYFGVSESFNLTQYRMSNEEISFIPDEVKDEKLKIPDEFKIKSTAIVNNNIHSQKELVLDSSKKIDSSQQEIGPLLKPGMDRQSILLQGGATLLQASKTIQAKENKNKAQNVQIKVQLRNLKGALEEKAQKFKTEFMDCVNVFYFHYIFKKLEQMIGDATKSPQEWTYFFEKIVENQNVYVEEKYQLLQYINNPKVLENIDINIIKSEDILKLIKEFDLSDKKCFQDKFVRLVLSKCQNLEKVMLSNMQPALVEFFQQSLADLEVIGLDNLREINVSKNSGDISGFIGKVFEKSKNLKVLSMQQMDFKSGKLDFFQLIPASLEILDLSKNKNFESLSFLNMVFARCKKLKILNLSDIGITEEKIVQVDFNAISTDLEDLNLSNNQGINSVEFINTIITKCQNLTSLNISNINLDHIKNNLIKYSSISPKLKYISLSHNSIVFFMDFIVNLLTAAPLLEELDFSYQTHRNVYESKPIKTPPNVLQTLNVSGNTIHNTFQYIPDIISSSKSFSKLIVKNFNLQKSRLTALFGNRADAIEVIDISDNDTIADISPLNALNKTHKFHSFIASNTCLNNYLLNQLDLYNLFSDLTTLDFTGNVSILDYSFFNKLFVIAKNLKVLNISKMQALQSQINTIDFSTLPKTVTHLDISGNNNIIEFVFLNAAFAQTQDSLMYLNLSGLNADDSSFKNIDFTTLLTSIQTIDLTNNPRLQKVPFLSMLLNSDESALRKLMIDKFLFDITQEQEDFSQVQKLECQHIHYKYNFFTQSQYLAHINIIKFIKFLQIQYRRKYLVDRQDEVEERFGRIFQLFLKELLKRQSEDKNLQVLLHFFFLLGNEEHLGTEDRKDKMLLFSPYSLFQGCQKVIINDEMTKEDVIFDAYNLTFFSLDMVRRDQTRYIFSYEKFYFQKVLGEFYIQNFGRVGGEPGDIAFIKRLNSLLLDKHAEQAFLPTQLKLTVSTLKKSNCNEFELLYLVNRTPPATLISKGLTIQFVKSWYAINYYAPLSCSTTISVDFELLENTSLGNYLSLRAYKSIVRGYCASGILANLQYFTGLIRFAVFGIFATQPVQFRFDHSVIILEKKLDSRLSIARNTILKVLYPIYQFVCFFGVLYFSQRENLVCGQGVSWNSYIMYGVYAIVTFGIEAELFVFCLEYIRHLIPAFKPDCQRNFPNNIINSLKSALLNIHYVNLWYVNYSISFVQSQLSRFDYFTDIGFLYTLYICEEKVLFWISLVGLAVHLVFNFITYIFTFTGQQTYQMLVTARIDKLCQMCQLVSFQAVSELLNVVSPSNSITFRQKMVNQKIVTSFVQILFENIPQIIIQVVYLANKNVLSYSVLFSILSSCLMLVVNFYKFLTIIPSRLAQEDFNALNSRKKIEVLPSYQRNMQNYEVAVLKLDLMDQLKCIKSTKYYRKYLLAQELPRDQIQKQLNLAKELRKFAHNLALIQHYFGNLTFVDDFSTEDDQRNMVLHPVENQNYSIFHKNQQDNNHAEIVQVSGKNSSGTKHNSNFSIQNSNHNKQMSEHSAKQLLKEGDHRKLIEKQKQDQQKKTLQTHEVQIKNLPKKQENKNLNSKPAITKK